MNPVHHVSLDRIENLKVSISLYLKSETLVKIDELQVGWQELVVKGQTRSKKSASSKTSSAASAASLSPLKEPAKDSNPELNQGQETSESLQSSKKKSKRKEKINQIDTETTRKSLIYTVLGSTSRPDPSDLLTKNLSTLNISSHSSGLERSLKPLSEDSSTLTTYFASVPGDILGRPTQNRWTSQDSPNSYSEMKFYASFKKPTITADSVEETALLIEPQTKDEEDIEQLLCTITYYGNGNFVMSPNFTSPHTPSKMHSFKIGDDLYEYTLTNTSLKISKENEHKEHLIFTEFFKRQLKSRLSQLPKDFDMVPPGYEHRVHFLGSLVKARDFNSNLLYCSYTIHVSHDWKSDTDSSNILAASTQVSYGTLSERSRVTYFGHPIELLLLSSSTHPTPPTLRIKVMSIDGEDRHSVEGYATLTLPREPGTYDFECPTFKPVAPRINELKTFFLGGAPEIEEYDDLETHRKAVNRYGFQTESSGTVTLKFQVLEQKFTVLESRMNEEWVSSRATNSTHDALERAKMRLAVLKQLDESPSAA